MESMERFLQEFNFTVYEAKILFTLIRYHTLNARDLSKYSSVPQPKIYENAIKLHQKDLINIIQHGKKKMFAIKPKTISLNYFQNYIRRIENLGSKISNIINKTYGSEESAEIPFIGIAGKKEIQEYIYMLAENAKNSFHAIIPFHNYDNHLIDILKTKAFSIDIKIIFQDREKIDDIMPLLPNASFFQLKSLAFNLVKNLMDKIGQFLPTEHKNSYIFHILQEIALHLEDLFALIVIDRKNSFFRIPVPINLPMAIFSSLPDLVKFHCEGIDQIFSASQKIS